MKKYMSGLKCSALLLFVVAFVIAVPFLMNVFYGRGCPLIDAWDKSDLMGYYGSIMTAAAAIAGVYFTLDYSKFKQMEYEKLRVKPYLQIMTSSNEVSLNNLFGIRPYEIYVCKDFNKEYTETGYGVLPNALYNLSITKDFRRTNWILKNSVFLNFDIRNIGADSAINIKVIFDNHTIANGFSLSKNESKFLRILIVFNKDTEINDKVILEDMKIRILYENIYGNQMYEQDDCIEGFCYTKSTHIYGYGKGSDADTPFFGNQIEIDN